MAITGVNSAAALFLDEIKAKILKFKITKEIIEENENEEKSQNAKEFIT